MKQTFQLFIPFVLLIFLNTACQQTEKADMILLNGSIITMDKKNPKVEAIAIKEDRILKLGTTEEINQLIGENTKSIDLKGQFAMPGFIEGHGHFSGLGKSLTNLNFLKAKNWDEIVQMVSDKAKTLQPGEWIEGRGWHQEKWDTPVEKQLHGYPFHDDLSAVSPDNPVVLVHASGHSLFANQKAMEVAGVNAEMPNPKGGEIVRDQNGNAIGVFEERAMDPIRIAYQEYLDKISKEELDKLWSKGIDLAEQECLSKGVTSFQDAGATFEEIEKYKTLAQKQELDLRLWVMLRQPYEEIKDNITGLPIVNAGNHFLTVKAIKSQVDGALGAFGAWLLKAYDDKPDFEGQNTTPVSEVKNIAQLAIENDLQLCVHAIGDRANRVVLNIYEEAFKSAEDKKDLRWRIEHAQHLDPKDIPRFKDLGVIASMQGIHCTSDAPFVVKRLGEERAKKGAYAWRSLLDNGVAIANGTDAPVEDVDPLICLYASVTRKRTDSDLVFFPEQSMTREEALHSYTLGNAYAAFEEKDKGSLEEGKLADIIVLSKNLLTCSDEDILETDVLYTIVGGAIKYEAKK